MNRFNHVQHSALEYWSTGVMEYWSNGWKKNYHHSLSPFLRFSVSPLPRFPDSLPQSPLTCSYAQPTRSTVASSMDLPMICMPTGSPSTLPQFMLMAGRPARLTETV